MHSVDARGIAVLLLSVVACAGKQHGGGLAAQPGDGIPAPGPSGDERWVYAGELRAGEEDTQPVKHEVALVESGRKQVAGHEVIELAVFVDGEPASEETVEQFSSAPFAVFGNPLLLVVGESEGAKAVWLGFGGGGRDLEGMVSDALGSDSGPTWLLNDAARKPRPSGDSDDYPVRFGEKVGEWDSVCTDFIHSGEESGDYFEWELCLAPDVGITRLMFDSVWGAYSLELKSAPGGFSL